MKIEQVILGSLIQNEAFMRKVIAFLKPEYFGDSAYRQMFETINSFIIKYNKSPTPDVLAIELSNLSVIEPVYEQLKKILTEISAPLQIPSLEWLLNSSEAFCKDRAIYNALYDCIKIADGKDKKYNVTAIPELLKGALAVSFDTNIGHDYIEDSAKRYEYYHNVDEKIPFDLDLMNQITGGGLPKKALAIVAATTGGGKSIFLCHHAANCLRLNKNVLYITMEMSEERIAERIDANLMNIKLNDLRVLGYDMYSKMVEKLKETVKGKLIIKEYPTGVANALTFRNLLDELKLKKNFSPDVVIVDYINICASSRYKDSSGANSYTIIKAIAEELRGLAVEYNVLLFSATQLNRGGFENSDVNLTHTAESMGLPHTADFFFSLISTDELDQLNQIMIKQLKNRYEDQKVMKRFVVGLDKSKMTFYDVESSAQKGLMNSEQTMENKTENNFGTWG